jgi:hypothetical protein
MEPAGAQPSFIPHDAGIPVGRRESSGGLWDLLMLIGILALAVSSALAVGVFLYQQYLKTTINRDLDQLKQAKQRFDPTLVDKMTKLDNRMHSADQLLAIHMAPSAFFYALNQVTAQTVSYTNLELDVNDPKRITLKMQGVARSVNSIAFQADLLSKSGVFTNPIFSGLDRQKDGVHFEVTMLVNPGKINFESVVSAATNAGRVTTQPVVTQPIVQTSTSTHTSSTSTSSGGNSQNTQ